jgi:hypothetical protein
MPDSYRISSEALERAVHALEMAMYPDQFNEPDDRAEIAEAYDELRAIQGEHEGTVE